MKNLMPHLLTAGVVFMSATNISAQLTAQDWTKYDCDGNSHSLYSYLDSSEVVVMEFGMGCSSCSDAAIILDNIKSQYDISHPGKVNFFYLDYWNGNDCANDVIPFMTTYGLSWPAFDHADTELSYYMSGSPMPAIIITAGIFHAVYYEKGSFLEGDTTNVIAAIDQALDDMDNVSIVESAFVVQPLVYPNPANAQSALRYTLKNPAEMEISIYNMLGEKLNTITHQHQLAGQYHIDLNVKDYPAGKYIIRINTGNSLHMVPLHVQH